MTQVLLATSIRQNIAWGMEGATLDDVVAAARAANCHDFISAFPREVFTSAFPRDFTGAFFCEFVLSLCCLREVWQDL
eukprot:52842-Eustigmatos_ZCMA.PRE.1